MNSAASQEERQLLLGLRRVAILPIHNVNTHYIDIIQPPALFCKGWRCVCAIFRAVCWGLFTPATARFHFLTVHPPAGLERGRLIRLP